MTPMKARLRQLSLVIGITAWALTVIGVGYFHWFSPAENTDPTNIFKPGAFESVVLVLYGAGITGLGLLVGLISLSGKANRKASWIAVTVNGLYCIPILVLLVLQDLS